MSLCSLLLRRDSRLVVLGEGATVPRLRHGLAALGAAGTMLAGIPVATSLCLGLSLRAGRTGLFLTARTVGTAPVSALM